MALPNSTLFAGFPYTRDGSALLFSFPSRASADTIKTSLDSIGVKGIEAEYVLNDLRDALIQAADTTSRPDILEKMTYHQHERDDMTLGDCLEYLTNRWKKIHQRPERALIMQITELLAAAPNELPQIARVKP